MAVPTPSFNAIGLVNGKLDQAEARFNQVGAPVSAAAPVTDPSSLSQAGLPQDTLDLSTGLPAADPSLAAPGDTSSLLSDSFSQITSLLMDMLKKKESAPSLAQQYNSQEFGRVRPLEKPVKVKSVGVSPLSDSGDE